MHMKNKILHTRHAPVGGDVPRTGQWQLPGRATETLYGLNEAQTGRRRNRQGSSGRERSRRRARGTPLIRRKMMPMVIRWKATVYDASSSGEAACLSTMWRRR